MISFAFIAPLLFAVSIGIIDFGMALWTKSTIANSAREAARYASIRGEASSFTATDEEIRSVAIATAAGIGVNHSQVAVEWSPNNTPGSTVTVRVNFTYDFLVGGFVPLPPLQLQAVSSRAVF